MVIDSLTVDQYHHICYWELSRFRSASGFAPTMTVNLRAIIFCSGNQLEDSFEVALMPDVEVFRGPWNASGTLGEIMEDGWTRFSSSEVSGTTICFQMWSHPSMSWLSQANHIFSRVQITSNLEDYVVVHNIFFNLSIPAASSNPPSGFLFLCPPEDFRTGPSSFSWPDCSAYWSLDPIGTERLSMEDTMSLGLPSIRFLMGIRGTSWDANVYAGLRHLHQAKGFDPDSQEVARHLGERLYRLPSELDALFAHYGDIALRNQGVLRVSIPEGMTVFKGLVHHPEGFVQMVTVGARSDEPTKKTR
ncbi:hypothetical protein B0H19DRAFT_1385801 [Mycena capillaripes]|nr:hypothetical protein B0H19DRAFT_1385801 [Mycena capillaripes]